MAESSVSESEFGLSDVDQATETDENLINGIQPFMFEPEASDSDTESAESTDGDGSDSANLIGNTIWLGPENTKFMLLLLCRCSCGCCQAMPTAVECVCCQDIPQVFEKLNELSNPVQCITMHPGFNNVCLDVWVLQAASYSYIQQYGTAAFNGSIHK